MSPSPGRPCSKLLLLLGGLLLVSGARADDWPQWLGPQRDGVWRETGILSKFPAEGPKVRWRTPVGPGYGGPAVAQGKVFLMDRLLDDGASNPKKASAVRRDKTAGKERVLCLDEATGKVLWKHEYPSNYDMAYPSGPRVTPLVHGDKVYTLGAMGDLFCLEVASGKVAWSKSFVKDHGAAVPLYGWGTHALVDGNQLICTVGGKDSGVVSYDKESGKVLWKALASKEPGYSGAMIHKVGDTRQLMVWDGQAFTGLDPATGKVLWKFPLAVQFGMAIATPRLQGDRVFLTGYFGGNFMLQLDPAASAPKVVWKGGKGSCIATPLFQGDHIYGVDNMGTLRCLKADTGDQLWTAPKANNDKTGSWGCIFLVAQDDKVWLANEHGDLILAKLTPQGYEELTRARLIAPDNLMASRPVVWSHPAFANQSIYARNDQEIVCVSLAAGK